MPCSLQDKSNLYANVDSISPEELPGRATWKSLALWVRIYQRGYVELCRGYVELCRDISDMLENAPLVRSNRRIARFPKGLHSPADNLTK